MSGAELRWAEQIAKEVIERECEPFELTHVSKEERAAILNGRTVSEYLADVPRIPIPDDNELTEDDAFLEYADARADEIDAEPLHTHVYVNVRLCQFCGRQPHLYYRQVEGVQVEGEVL